MDITKPNDDAVLENQLPLPISESDDLAAVNTDQPKKEEQTPEAPKSEGEDKSHEH